MPLAHLRSWVSFAVVGAALVISWAIFTAYVAWPCPAPPQTNQAPTLCVSDNGYPVPLPCFRPPSDIVVTCPGNLLSEAGDFFRKEHEDGAVLHFSQPFGLYAYGIGDIEYDRISEGWVLGSWEFNVPLRNLFQKLWMEAQVEPFASPVEKDLVFLDVGANVGTYSFPISKFAKVISVEALPRNVRFLKRAALLNGVKDNIAFAPYAVGEKRDSFLIAYGVESTNNVIAKTAEQIRGTQLYTLGHLEEPFQEIKVFPFDEIYPKFIECGFIASASQVRVLKIDIEGMETFFFRGAMKFFSETKPILLMEFASDLLAAQGTSKEEVTAQLRDMGYVSALDKLHDKYTDVVFATPKDVPLVKKYFKPFDEQE